MTNREWLNSLSNEDLVSWIYAEGTMTFNIKTMQYKIYAPNYSPCLAEIVAGAISNRLCLKKWLDEERIEYEKENR